MIKDDTNKPICRAAMETQTQRTDFGHSWGRQGVEGEGGMYGKTNTETSSCVKHIASGKLWCNTGSSVQCSEDGRRKGGDTCVIMADSSCAVETKQHHKTIIFQLNINFKKERKWEKIEKREVWGGKHRTAKAQRRGRGSQQQ